MVEKMRFRVVRSDYTETTLDWDQTVEIIETGQWMSIQVLEDETCTFVKMTEDAPDCCRRSFAESIKDTAKRLLEDPSFAPRRVSILRLEVCESCDKYTEAKTCEICQCFMPAKVKMSNMKCPIDKWIEHVH